MFHITNVDQEVTIKSLIIEVFIILYFLINQNVVDPNLYAYSRVYLYYTLKYDYKFNLFIEHALYQ